MDELKTITRIEQQKNNKRRYNIYLDDEYAFSVHEDILVSNRLLKGKEIEVVEMNNILAEEEKNKVWQKALKYLSFKPRTKEEVKQYLLKNGYKLDYIKEVLDKIEEQNLLNDHLYAELFVKQRITSNPKGKKLLAIELKNKGIDDFTVENSLEQFDEELEYKLALELIEKRKYRFNSEDQVKSYKKMASFLERRGFSYTTIKRILNNFKSDFS